MSLAKALAKDHAVIKTMKMVTNKPCKSSGNRPILPGTAA